MHHLLPVRRSCVASAIVFALTIRGPRITAGATATRLVSSRLSPLVRTLIRRHVHSVGELELLVMLHAERDRGWSVAAICEALGCPKSWAVAQLAAMARAGLLERTDGKWHFSPESAELEQATAALQEAYRLQSRDVVRFVFSTPGRDLQEFSDAFRVRREER
jgi:hypothetical protein